MKVKALIQLSYKKKEYPAGEIFEMSQDDFKVCNKKYVEQVATVGAPSKSEPKKEGE